VHLRRGDPAINAVAAALQCLAWFNPLIHLGVDRMRVDQEMSCDASVIASFPGERRTYAQALLDTQLAAFTVPLGCHWPAVGDHPLKERVAMLTRPLPARSRTLAGAALVLLLGLSAGWTAWASAPPRLIGHPVWTQRPTGEDLARSYPAKAEKSRTPGSAVIGCTVAASGRLRDCKVISEAPARAGFGAAALKISQQFQMAALSGDGQRTAGARVRIPMKFVLHP
jgi:TonB family protein